MCAATPSALCRHIPIHLSSIVASVAAVAGTTAWLGDRMLNALLDPVKLLQACCSWVCLLQGATPFPALSSLFLGMPASLASQSPVPAQTQPLPSALPGCLERYMPSLSPSPQLRPGASVAQGWFATCLPWHQSLEPTLSGTKGRCSSGRHQRPEHLLESQAT